MNFKKIASTKFKETGEDNSHKKNSYKVCDIYPISLVKAAGGSE